MTTLMDTISIVLLSLLLTLISRLLVWRLFTKKFKQQIYRIIVRIMQVPRWETQKRNNFAKVFFNWKVTSFQQLCSRVQYVRLFLSEKSDIHFKFLLLKVDENLQYFNASTISSYKDQILQSLMQTCPKWIVKVCTAIWLELVFIWLEH